VPLRTIGSSAEDGTPFAISWQVRVRVRVRVRVSPT